jgi:adenylate cyclase class IV
MTMPSRMQLQAKLSSLPFVRCLQYSSTLDRYYDTRDSDGLRQDVFLRIRNQRCLQIKYHEQADPLHVHCTEREFPLSADPAVVREMHTLCARFLPGWREAETIEEALQVNSLVEYAQIEMLRTRYACEDLLLCIDDVEGLGDFFEVETSCEEVDQVPQAEARLHRFVSNLGLPGLERVQTGYVELWLSRYHPSIYQLCTHKDHRAENAKSFDTASLNTR